MKNFIGFEKSDSNALNLTHNGTPALILYHSPIPEDKVCFPSTNWISILSVFPLFKLTIKRLK